MGDKEGKRCWRGGAGIHHSRGFKEGGQEGRRARFLSLKGHPRCPVRVKSAQKKVQVRAEKCREQR